MTSPSFCVNLFSVMGHMKSLHIDWLNAQDDTVVAPVEGTHEGYRVVTAMRASDLACAVAYAQDEPAEDFGWFGDEALCGE